VGEGKADRSQAGAAHEQSLSAQDCGCTAGTMGEGEGAAADEGGIEASAGQSPASRRG